jgi:hypothetical protein
LFETEGRKENPWGLREAVAREVFGILGIKADLEKQLFVAGVCKLLFNVKGHSVCDRFFISGAFLIGSYLNRLLGVLKNPCVDIQHR